MQENVSHQRKLRMLIIGGFIIWGTIAFVALLFSDDHGFFATILITPAVLLFVVYRELLKSIQDEKEHKIAKSMGWRFFPGFFLSLIGIIGARTTENINDASPWAALGVTGVVLMLMLSARD